MLPIALVFTAALSIGVIASGADSPVETVTTSTVRYESSKYLSATSQIPQAVHRATLDRFYKTVAENKRKEDLAVRFYLASVAEKNRLASIARQEAQQHVNLAPVHYGIGPSSCSTPGTQSVPSMMACIKACESGNYAESTHPGAGSGAYQFTPGTWQTWSARAGYPGYAYAYLAPPAVQDAVTAYTLANGGASNWSPRYGRDPCTVGKGG